MKLCIADPPYPPQFSVRNDLACQEERVTMRSRATRWYGEPPGIRKGTQPADYHPEAAEWDELSRHRQLLLHLLDNYDGFAIATAPDGLGAYHPLPVVARVGAWVKLRPIPGGGRLQSAWEPVIFYVPEERRARTSGLLVQDTLVAAAPNHGFAGAKPPAWTRWVLDALGYDPEEDTLVDLFPGSGAVSDAAAQGVLL